jgi:multisubunit Na+/H+ antiporter MnhE subunit
MRIWSVIGSWILYLLLTQNLEFGNLLLGLMLAIGLTFLFRPAKRSLDLRRLPRALLSGVRYLGVLLYDMLSGGLFVARIIIRRDIRLEPGIIPVPAGCDSELANALSAHAISLAPGELVVEIDEAGVMYTHTLDVSRSQEYIEDAQQLRTKLLRYIFP